MIEHLHDANRYSTGNIQEHGVGKWCVPVSSCEEVLRKIYGTKHI